MVKKLLLIGGTGFFGKSFLDSFKRGLLKKWDISKIILISRNVEKIKIEAPELLSPKIQLLSADISITNSLPEADYVIHAAASTDARAYLSRPDIETKNILGATSNYCKLAELVHSKSNILYISSGAVYGYQPSNLEFLEEEYAFSDLNRLPEGKREYAFAKRNAEREFQNLGSKNINVSIARCFAFVGPWLPRDQHFAVGNFIEDGFLGRTINIKANFPVYRSYMHSDDLIFWLMTICKGASSECPIYNVGSDRALSIVELAELIAKKFNIKVNKPNLLLDKIDRYIPSIAKARNELNLDVSIDISSAINKTIQEISLNRFRE